MTWTRRDVGSLVCAFIALLLAMWCSTGTLTIYAATLDPDVVWVTKPCGYLANIDHPHHLGTFLMLQGEPRETWESSVVLRRVLHPLLAYPLMRLLGFDLGGVLANAVLQIVAWAGLVLWCAKRLGMVAAKSAGWLLATYPGIAYWVGSPFSYAIIVPATIGTFLALLDLSHEERTFPAFLLGLVAGIASTGYDLIIYFGGAALLVVACRRRFQLLAPVAVGLALPTVIVQLILSFVYRVPQTNTNLDVYKTVLQSYLHPGGIRAWVSVLRELPLTLAWDFVFANFAFLPIVFLALLLLGRIRCGPTVSLVERCILLSVFASFLFNNLAPPYSGWQMRGRWIARLYQPVFIVFLYYCGRAAQWSTTHPGAYRRLIPALVSATVVGNAAVVFGPVVPVRGLTSFSGFVYASFYEHSPAGSLLTNIDRHGRRPLGFCRRTPSNSSAR